MVRRHSLSFRSRSSFAQPRHEVGTERLHTQGFGEDYPLAGNEEEAGRAQNRRTELVLPQ